MNFAKLLAEVTLTFPDKNQEANFKKHYQQTLLRMAQLAFVAGGLMGLMNFLQHYRIESRRKDDPFQWATDDPRIPFFAMMIFITAEAIVGLLYTFLKPRMKLPCCCSDDESCVFVVLVLFTIALGGADRWHLGGAYGMDPTVVWASDVRGASGSHLLATDAGLTLVSLFVPLRVSRSWVVHLSALSMYFTRTAAFGTPYPDQEVNRSGFLTILAFFAHFGAWRNERQARLQWLSLQGKQAQIVNERVMRFDAERQLDQVAGTWWQTASGNEPFNHSPSPQLLDYTSTAPSQSTRPKGETPKGPVNLDPECQKPKCFFPTGTKLICQKSEAPGSFIVCDVENVSSGAFLLALDRMSGEPTWVEACGVQVDCPQMALNWSELTFAGIDGRKETTVIVANSILTRTDSKHGSTRSLWREPARLSLGTDMLHGAEVCSRSSDSSDLVNIKSTLLCLFGKRMAAAPSSVVSVELPTPESHALLFLGSTSTPELMVAVSCFTGHRVQFVDKDGTTPEMDTVSSDTSMTYTSSTI